jgi:ferredoxin-type protein NapH
MRSWRWRPTRRLFQAASLVVSSLPWLGFLRSCPYPFLHCVSCPLAVAVCPVGALQHFIILGRFPLLVAGFMTAVAALWGRLSCGFMCPFGLFQDLLARAGTALRFAVRAASGATAPPTQHHGRLIRWAVLATLVIAAPALLHEPWFCKLCPAGLLEAGLPHVALRPALRSMIGTLFAFKVLLLAALIIAALRVRRPFCRFVCPVGLFLGMGNRVSRFHLEVDKEGCTACGRCRELCPVDIEVWRDPRSPDCIHCLDCASCPHVRSVTTGV